MSSHTFFSAVTLILLAAPPLFSKDPLVIVPTPPKSEEPWLTGTLLSTATSVVPVGNLSLEPFLFLLDEYVEYDAEWRAHSTPKRFSATPLLFGQLGLTERIDFQFAPQFSYTREQGKSATRFGDLPLGLDFQLIEQKENTWKPSILFTFLERFPTGKYQKLDPKKHGVDATGEGSYASNFILVFSWLYRSKTEHFLHAFITLEYTVATSVDVKGFNTYGGGFGTKGRVKPGDVFTGLLSFEYSLTRNWALALDILNIYENKTPFSGKPGVDENGNPAIVGLPSQNEISLAPAIEYNFSDKMGLIAGPWFTVAGRNAPQFIGGGIGFYYYFSFSKKQTK